MVHLIAVDNLHIDQAKQALDICQKTIDFGDVTLISDAPIKSKADYSYFVFKDLINYITKPYCMICQYDGFILNPYLWQDRFLEYDYIGAPWWYDFNNVGNGGFSLRSYDLMEELTKPEYNDCHPEDDRIARKYRRRLEDRGFSFAPEWLAAQFAYEPNPKYRTFKNNTFGQHAHIKL